MRTYDNIVKPTYSIHNELFKTGHFTTDIYNALHIIRSFLLKFRNQLIKETVWIQNLVNMEQIVFLTSRFLI